MNNERLLQLGLKDGKIVHIDEVSNGIACNCVCPKCNSELIARNKGLIKVHHFAHITEYNCKGAVESALHLMAKEILIETRRLFIPSYSCYISSIDKEVTIFNYNKNVEFESVELEKKIIVEDTWVVADAICSIKNKPLIVEFANTHFSDENKIKKLRKLGIPCLEIDISFAEQNRNDLRRKLQTDFFYKTWLVNIRGEERAFELEKKLTEKKEREEAIKFERAKRELEQKEILRCIQEEEYLKWKNENERIREDKRKEAISKGKLLKKCPVKDQILNGFRKTSFGKQNVVRRLLNGEEWNNQIYDYSPQFIDMFINKERIILIPEGFEMMSDEERAGYLNIYTAVIKYYNLKSALLTNPCHLCNLHAGKFEDFIICKYETEIDVAENFNYDNL